MSGVAIRVENVGKRYRIGGKQPYHRLSEILSGLGKSAFRWPARVLGGGVDPASRNEDFWALKDVSFEVNEGEVVGIIGHNGAGKSTLLKVLSRITEPTTGRFGVNGRMGSLLEVGTGFHPELTGRENIYLNGAILGMTPKRVRKHFDEIVAFAELEKFLDTPVKRYSSGMYVRLGFAVAAHLEPDILVVDEVLAVGDNKFQKQCLAKMDQAAKSGRTVLFVSHNLSAIRRLCSRVCLLSAGQMQFSGSASDAIGHYLGHEKAPKNQTSVDLSTFPSRYGSGEASIVSARRLTHEDGAQICTGDEFAMQFDVHCETPVDIYVSAVCVTEDGIRVLYLSGLDSVDSPLDAVSGSSTVEFRLPRLSLTPGSYSWSLGLHTAGQRPLDVVEGVLPFEVHSPAESSRPFVVTNQNGFCNPVSIWKAQRKQQ